MGAVSSLGVGSAEQAGSSDAGRLVLVFRKMMKEQVELMVIETVKKVIVPIMEDLVRKVVKEQLESTREKILAGGNRTVTNGRRLRLRFKDEVSENVITGTEIEGKEGMPIRLELIDEATGQVNEIGLESSATVEILFLEAGDNPNEHIQSHQDFISRIVKQGDKTKPQFSKSCHVCLEKGTGALNNAKLANASNWTKKCKYRLGARVLDNLNGIKVLEAWTEPFLVSDNRCNKYGKSEIPLLSDCVWRLDGIGRGGKPCKRLEKKKVNTVEQFLFLLSVRPKKLKKILTTSDKAWKAIVKHAQTCDIDDKKIYMYNDSTEGNMSVLFDAVGKLKGIIHDSYYVTETCLSEAEKDRARKLLLSAFKNWKDSHRTFFSDEVDIIQKFPYQERNDTPIASMEEERPGIESTGFENTSSNHGDPTVAVDSGQRISAATEEHFQDLDQTISENINHGNPFGPGLERNEALNTSVQEEIPDTDWTISENVDHGDPTEPLTSSLGLSPSIEQSGNVNNTLVHQVPCQANYAAVPGHHDSTMLECVSHRNPTEPSNSAQNISPSIGPSGDENDYYPVSSVSTHLGQPESFVYGGPIRSPANRFFDMHDYCGGNGLFEAPGDEFQNYSVSTHWEQPEFFVYTRPIYSLDSSRDTHLDDRLANGLVETPGDEVQIRQQRNAGSILLVGAVAIRWKRKMALGQREMNVSKRQRIESQHVKV